MKAFTLIEVLVVLAIISLGWLWLPSLFSGTSSTTAHRFEDSLEQLIARARMEAIARQTPVAFGVNANPASSQCAVGLYQNGEFQPFTQINLPAEVSFNKSAASIRGTAGVLDVANGAEVNGVSDFWYLWSFNSSGQPVDKDKKIAQDGTLVFTTSTSETKWRISDEGALWSIP